MASVHFEQMGAHSAEDLNKLAWGKTEGEINPPTSFFFLGGGGRSRRRRSGCVSSRFLGGDGKGKLCSHHKVLPTQKFSSSSFASSAEIVFVSDALLLLLPDIHAGDYSFMVALPPSDEWVLRTRPPGFLSPLINL